MFFFQAEDGIRDLVRSRGLGDVYKRQVVVPTLWAQARLEKSKISLAVEGKSSFHHLPLTIAEQRGFFGAEGLEVDISDLTGDSPAALSLSLIHISEPTRPY